MSRHHTTVTIHDESRTSPARRPQISESTDLDPTYRHMVAVSRRRMITGSPWNLRGSVVQRRPCPSCTRTVVQIYRPGRARVYCNAACRQRAYRWRRDHAIRWHVDRDGPAVRSSTPERRHALRVRRDRASGLVDHRGRRLTICGTFARPSYYDRATHFDFLPEHPWSCASCDALIGAPPPRRDRPRRK